jgi:hypothetical protein
VDFLPFGKVGGFAGGAGSRTVDDEISGGCAAQAERDRGTTSEVNETSKQSHE